MPKRSTLFQKAKGKFLLQKVADACGIQKTYLSRVLRTDGAHLSEQQLPLAAKFVGLGKKERRFLQLLRQRDKITDADLLQELELEVEEARKNSLTTGEYIEAKSSSGDTDKYYLDPPSRLGANDTDSASVR